ncbi:MAG: hypothetical protein ACE5FO_04090 [Parvularculaceae bacterium]
MMMKIIPIILQAIFVVFGVGAGFWIKSLPIASDAAGIEAGEDDPREPAEKPEKKKKETKGKHGGGHGKGDNSGSGYMKFGRQFIVPVLKQDEVKSLVIMELNIETPSDAVESLYTQEPKLRDALLGRLLELSTRGVFNDQLIEKENLDFVRTELLEVLREVIGDDAQDVLILGITRQSV